MYIVKYFFVQKQKSKNCVYSLLVSCFGWLPGDVAQLTFISWNIKKKKCICATIVMVQQEKYSFQKIQLKRRIRISIFTPQFFCITIGLGSWKHFLDKLRRIDHITSKSDPQILAARKRFHLEKTSDGGNGTCRVSPSPNRRRKLDSLCIAVYPLVASQIFDR